MKKIKIINQRTIPPKTSSIFNLTSAFFKKGSSPDFFTMADNLAVSKTFIVKDLPHFAKTKPIKKTIKAAARVGKNPNTVVNILLVAINKASCKFVISF